MTFSTQKVVLLDALLGGRAIERSILWPATFEDLPDVADALAITKSAIRQVSKPALRARSQCRSSSTQRSSSGWVVADFEV